MAEQNQEFTRPEGDAGIKVEETDRENKNNKRHDVHPLEILSYNKVWPTAKNFYKLYPDSIKDWKLATREKVTEWIKTQIKDDPKLEKLCLEALELGIKHFEEEQLKSSN